MDIYIFCFLFGSKRWRDGQKVKNRFLNKMEIKKYTYVKKTSASLIKTHNAYSFTQTNFIDTVVQ